MLVLTTVIDVDSASKAVRSRCGACPSSPGSICRSQCQISACLMRFRSEYAALIASFLLVGLEALMRIATLTLRMLKALDVLVSFADRNSSHGDQSLLPRLETAVQLHHLASREALRLPARG